MQYLESRTKGELHPNYEPLVRRAFMHMDGSVESLAPTLDFSNGGSFVRQLVSLD